MCALLLTTKMTHPPLPACLVERQRLLDALDADPGVRLVLLSTPPGYGKTTLLSHWVSRPRREHVAWITLDERDNSLQRFGMYLQSCLEPLDAGPDRIADALPDDPAAVEDAMTGWINALAGGLQPGCTLVLDDYHVITNPDIHRVVKFWLTHLPGDCRLVISGRGSPPLGLAQLRAANRIVELDSTDLAFTPDESAEFFGNQPGGGLNPADLGGLLDQIEGWAAGLQLAASALRSRTNGFTPRPAETCTRYIREYLAEQVFQLQPLEVQEFLLETSVLQNLETQLCDAVWSGGIMDAGIRPQETGQAHALLVYLEQNNLFVQPVDGGEPAGRYHTLFADFLRVRLKASRVGRTVQCHARAARWLDEHGRRDQARYHYEQVSQADPRGLYTGGPLHEKASSELPADGSGRFVEPKRIKNLFNLTGSLSDREVQVLRLMARGMTYAEIARELVIALSTVQTHVKNTYLKLNAHSSMEAVERARQMHIIN